MLRKERLDKSKFWEGLYSHCTKSTDRANSDYFERVLQGNHFDWCIVHPRNKPKYNSRFSMAEMRREYLIRIIFGGYTRWAARDEFHTLAYLMRILVMKANGNCPEATYTFIYPGIERVVISARELYKLRSYAPLYGNIRRIVSLV